MDKLILLSTTAAFFCSLSMSSGNLPNANEDSVLVDARDELGAIANYIADRKGRLALRGQSTDMFGKPQDPKKAQAIQKERVVAAVKPKPTIPLQQILDALPVTMIDPLGDRVVLAGAPPISKGETLELAFGGQQVMLRFEGARSNGAYFREMSSKKLGLRAMTRLPEGIQRGNQGPKGAGGIHKIVPNQPKNIKLDLNLNGLAEQPL